MMEPPQASSRDEKTGSDAPAAVSVRAVTVLKKRADFQRASRGARVARTGFILQMRKRDAGEASGIRVGFTCSRKVGNAVARNRAKRRLREIARLVLPGRGQAGMDYVLVGRKQATADLSFDRLQADFVAALDVLHGEARK